MRQAKFYLEKRKDKEGNPITENVPIRMSFHFNGNRLEYYTKIRITNAKNFNTNYFKTNKSFVKPNEPDARRLIQRLKEMKGKVEGFYDSAIALEITPTIKYLKEKLDGVYKRQSTEPKQKLVKDAFIEYLAFIKENNRSNSTWQKYNTTFNHLSSVFSKEINTLGFSDINTAFIEKFKRGIIKKGFEKDSAKKEYLNNTVVKYLRSFRGFLNWCKDEKRMYYSGNAKFENMQENEIDIIYLTKEHLDQLRNTPMLDSRLDRVKDVFLFGCYTSMRYQDIKNLKKIDVREADFRFYISKGKHTTWQANPLIPQTKALLEKYKNLNGDKALPVLSNQKMNIYIKEVMKLAGINDIVSLKKLKGDGTFEERQYELWELVSCHTAEEHLSLML